MRRACEGKHVCCRETLFITVLMDGDPSVIMWSYWGDKGWSESFKRELRRMRLYWVGEMTGWDCVGLVASSVMFLDHYRRGAGEGAFVEAPSSDAVKLKALIFCHQMTAWL